MIRECNTKTARAYRVQKGDELFKGTGQWFLRTMAELETKSANLMKKACIHVEARKLTLEQIEQINRSDWYNEMEELIGNVQRGQRGTA